MQFIGSFLILYLYLCQCLMYQGSNSPISFRNFSFLPQASIYFARKHLLLYSNLLRTLHRNRSYNRRFLLLFHLKLIRPHGCSNILPCIYNMHSLTIPPTLYAPERFPSFTASRLFFCVACTGYRQQYRR